VTDRPAHPTHYPPGALVTGAARRIGRAIALDLGTRGWRVAVHYNRSASAAADVVAEIRDAGGEAVALQADLNDEDTVTPLVPHAARAVGPLGVLVNNASVFEPDDATATPRAVWDRHMEPHLRAPFLLMSQFARQRPAEAGGVIVNLLDSRVWNPAPGFTSYTVSKVGLWAMTRQLAQELAPWIRVNAIGPGPALPGPRQTQADFEQQCASMPLGIGTAPAEICAALQFILAARAMTGQMIALDGGQHLGWAWSDDPSSLD
jgi:NAD(P)-dependent dehydrogenase (short-subunit alcohol dehydrogenase family)